MLDSDSITKILRREGHTSITVTGPMAAYRGSPEPVWLRILVETDSMKTIAVTDYYKKLKSIVAVQNQIPLAARIHRLIRVSEDQAIALIEHHDGILLWELESDRPRLFEVKKFLDQLISDLRKAGMVHADLRPWNILYHPVSRMFKCIDWGFSFPIGGTKCDKTSAHLIERGHVSKNENIIDLIDADKTLKVLKHPDRLEAEWNHPPGFFKWKPSPWK